MADLIYMTKTAWQNLLASIKTKAGYVGTLTASQAKTVVDSIQTGGGSEPDHYISFEYNSNSQPTYAILHGMQHIQQRQFYNNSMLQTVTFENCTGTIGDNAFYGCISLTSVTIPAGIDGTGGSIFQRCSGLTTVDIQANGPYFSLAGNCFNGCSNLSTIILRKTNGVMFINSSSAFTGTPIAAGTGTVYVPQALISSYQTATNWSALYAAGTQFVAIEGSIYE